MLLFACIRRKTFRKTQIPPKRIRRVHFVAGRLLVRIYIRTSGFLALGTVASPAPVAGLQLGVAPDARKSVTQGRSVRASGDQLQRLTASAFTGCGEWGHSSISCIDEVIMGVRYSGWRNSRRMPRPTKRRLSMEPPHVEPEIATGTGCGQYCGWPEISAALSPRTTTV